MTGTLYVYGLPGNARSTLVRGPLHEWLKGHGVPAMWTPRLKGWCVRTERIGDLIALAERDGLRVHMKGALS